MEGSDAAKTGLPCIEYSENGGYVLLKCKICCNFALFFYLFVLAVEEIVGDVVQFSEEEIGGLRGPGDDPEVAHGVEEEGEDDGEAQTRERLKFKGEERT